METWLKANFTGIANEVIVYQGANGFNGYDPTDPAGYFTSITTTPPTYTELSALPCAAEGWQKIFDQWKARGIIS